MGPMTEDQHTKQDPMQQYPQPEYPEQTQMDQHPGLDQEMQPEPDYGVETYKGSELRERRDPRRHGRPAVAVGLPLVGSCGPYLMPET
jgi:hypothetical protein